MAEESGIRVGAESKQQNSSASLAREQDAIYQKGRIVGRVAEPEMDLGAKEVRFGEICESDHLLIADECEFRDYRIMIQRIAYASKFDRLSSRPGRILRGCVADILGYREQ